MPVSDELIFAPAYRLVAMLKAREISSVELTNSFTEQIKGKTLD